MTTKIKDVFFHFMTQFHVCGVKRKISADEMMNDEGKKTLRRKVLT